MHHHQQQQQQQQVCLNYSNNRSKKRKTNLGLFESSFKSNEQTVMSTTTPTPSDFPLKMFLEKAQATNRHNGASRPGSGGRCRNATNYLHPNKHPKHLYLCLLALVTLIALISSLAPTARCQLDASSLTDGAAPQLGVGQQLQLQQQQQEMLVAPNSQVKIECRLPQMTPSQNRSYYWNFHRTSTGAKAHLLCFESKCIDESTFGIQLDMDTSLGTYDLMINNVTYELNDGLYNCDYKDLTPESKQTINREFRLTVLIPPQAPIIVPSANSLGQQSQVAREGQEYQLNCISHGGNPEPNITWFRNDQQISAPGGLGYQLMPMLMQGLKIEQSRMNGTTTSVLSWVPTDGDHQAVFKCAVWNKAMQSAPAHEKDFRLQVEYAPRISLGPFNPLKVLQGGSVTLPCLVNANPPVKGIRWFKDTRLISNQFNHTVHELKISDSGVYSCQADNGIAPLVASAHAGQVLGPAPNFLSLLGMAAGLQGGEEKSPNAVEAQLYLQVLYPPRVQVRPSRLGPLSEGEPGFALNCSVDASPPAHEYLWTKLDDPSFKRSSPVLEFAQLSASDMGNYTCTAFNRLEPSLQPLTLDKQASGSALVQVKHKPGLAELIAGQNGETELGSKTQLQCRAKPPGFPEPQYKFWKYSNQQKLALNKNNNSPFYNFFAAKADDEARYGCVAQNELGPSSEADAELVVNEAPQIINDRRSSEDARSPGEVGYSITVRASGKPQPKVSWFHRSPIDGRRVELSASEMLAKFKIETEVQPEQTQMRTRFMVISTLSFKKPLEVEDRGLYTVEFANGLSRAAQQDFQLHIHHSPIPLAKNQPLLSAAAPSGGAPSNQQQTSLIKAGFEPGETVNLTCRVSAYPRPDFFWYPESNEQADKPIDTNPRYKTTVSNPRDDIWESTLTFMLAAESDYGEYSCVTANRDPQTMKHGESVRIVVHLLHKTAPDPPTQLEPIDSTQDSITLQWLAGFDGGLALNHYLVQYAPDDGSGAGLRKRFGPQADTLGAFALMAGPYGGGPSNALDSIQLADSAEAAGMPRLFDCQARNPCTIAGLAPRQAYVFRVRAKNAHGPSEYSDELRATTRANVSQIPRILEASYNQAGNVLHFHVEPGSDYLLNNLQARIEVRPYASSQQQQTQTNQLDQLQPAELQGGATPGETAQAEWRQLVPPVPIRQEKAEAYLNMPAEMEQIRLTLCSRSNESLCGPEYVISVKSAASSFLQAERGLSFSILVSTLTLILVLGALATTLHSCCLSRKSKKVVDSIEQRNGQDADNKPGATGVSSANFHHLSQHHHLKANGHGSTTSTNSTSVANGNGSAASNNGLQSMDSQLNGAHLQLNGAVQAGLLSDHSSDQSRQAKLDSMLPPNYNHYADRATLMMEQQQQQQQYHQQQQHLMSADKLGSPFGLPNNALLGGQQQHSPSMFNGTGLQSSSLNYFNGYGNSTLDSMQQPLSLEAQQQQQMLDAGLVLNGANLEPGDQQAAMWQPSHHQVELDYSNYNNALAGYGQSGLSGAQEQQAMLESAYGTTTANGPAGGASLVSQHSALYDNTANSGQQFYMNAYQQQQQQQQQQYQQEMAVAQQQIYGTLTRNGYSNGNNLDPNENNNSQHLINNTSATPVDQHYSTTPNSSNGLVPPPPTQPPQPGAQESDYGTMGAGRAGRLIREIIV